MAYYNSDIVELTGSTDGVNTTFTTPSRYVSGTINVILNGQIYASDDDLKGWTEIDDTTIQMFQAPIAGDVLLAFYQDKDSEHLALDNVVGTPFDPNGVLP